MPVKSKSQWKRFHAMYERGEITKATLDHWIKGVDYDSLPDKVRKKKPKKKKRKSKPDTRRAIRRVFSR